MSHEPEHVATPTADPSAGVGRRRLVTAGTCLVGAAVLAWSLHSEPGSSMFYAATVLLAVVWLGGGLAAGPLPLGEFRGRVPVVLGVGAGAALAVLFVVGALVLRDVSLLSGPVEDVVAYADRGAGLAVLAVTVASGIGEEVFFRGALFAAVPGHPVVVTTLAYVVVTAVTGNVMLTFASLVLGAVVGVERAVTGGVLAPALTHVTWSATMLYALPALFS
ncbi:hypothetical protein SAMN04487968_11632 [Nocardioides terrae]|uniref:CAAX prenyl protease 2/Lysostaphin resistance protein A-like domain-containing protein n=1 Tax=Nocardioides terrae TaxID=574651 RepID=A0A1I1NJ32_9ACTN|nr:CPBP family intramembrane glutamic endopeptidase [Nocardioides terrae]SFC95488.1 hypothetical protein SAMN04487968_11632 [Nocardioides terrae]